MCARLLLATRWPPGERRLLGWNDDVRQAVRECPHPRRWEWNARPETLVYSTSPTRSPPMRIRRLLACILTFFATCAFPADLTIGMGGTVNIGSTSPTVDNVSCMGTLEMTLGAMV